MIKSGGNRVSPREIEDVIAECRDVVEAAVVGVPHEILGEAIVAFVVLSTGADSPAPRILDHCRRRMPHFKTPELVIHLSRLPYNGTGKILKAGLKPLAADLLTPAFSRESSMVFEDQSIRVLGIERAFASV